MAQTIGGNLIPATGSFLEFWNWQAPAGTSGVLPTPINIGYLDVGWYRLHRKRETAPVTYSGCFGAVRRPLVCDDWQLTLRVWWDYAFAPERVLTQGDTLAVKCLIGDPGVWMGYPISRADAVAGRFGKANGFGILPAGSTFIPYYYSPMARVTDRQTVAQSEGSESDGIVYEDVTIEGDSLLLYLQSSADAAAAGTYLQGLVNQNFVPFG